MIIHLRRRKRTLYLYFNYLKQEFYISTGIRVSDKDWEQNLNHNLNPFAAKVSRLKTDVYHAISRLEAMNEEVTPLAIREIVFGENIKKKPIVTYFNEWLVKREPSIAHNTYRKNKQLRNKLMDFEAYSNKRLYPGRFSKETFENFINWLTDVRKLNDNAVATLAATLRTFLKDTIPQKDFSFITLKEVYEDVIFLFPEELKKLKDAQLSGSLERARDLFLVGCYTGLRYSDYHKLDYHKPQNNFFELIQTKTKRKVYVPYTKALQEVLAKYDGKVPLMYNQKLNNYLKVIFKDLEFNRIVILHKRYKGKLKEYPFPLFEVITSHVARKTYIMTLIRSGVHIQTVMELSGHADYRTMKPYLAADISRLDQTLNKLNDEF